MSSIFEPGGRNLGVIIVAKGVRLERLKFCGDIDEDGMWAVLGAVGRYRDTGARNRKPRSNTVYKITK